MDTNKKFRMFFIALVGAFFLSPVNATIIQVDVEGEVDDSFISSYIPVGTTVTASIVFDITSSASWGPNISLISGSISWFDGVAQQIVPGAMSQGSSTGGGGNYSGFGFLFSGGLFPTINGLTGNRFDINFAVNHTAGDDWAETILNGSVLSMGVGYADANGSGRSCSNCVGIINSQSSFAVSDVPEPSALSLLGLACVFVCLRSRKH